jgi:hypothetical protein
MMEYACQEQSQIYVSTIAKAAAISIPEYFSHLRKIHKFEAFNW